MRVLILGGTGVFGSRLCRLLAGHPGIALTVAARDRAAVDALAHELGIAGRAFDWHSELDRVLGEGDHDVVVHAAGPFQGQDYGVAECCIRHGVHYLDLADDAAFVHGIDSLHDAALTAGVLVCAGASTAPALTGAVVEEALNAGPVERVAFGIMPGNDAPRGPALVAAIVGSAGRSIMTPLMPRLKLVTLSNEAGAPTGRACLSGAMAASSAALAAGSRPSKALLL